MLSAEMRNGNVSTLRLEVLAGQVAYQAPHLRAINAMHVPSILLLDRWYTTSTADRTAGLGQQGRW